MKKLEKIKDRAELLQAQHESTGYLAVVTQADADRAFLLKLVEAYEAAFNAMDTDPAHEELITLLEQPE